MNKQINKNIGVVQLWYNVEGKAVKGQFTPAEIKYDFDCVTRLLHITGIDADQLKQDSEILLSNWFNEINDIELADRGEYKISAEVEQCMKWDNGKVQYCRMRFYLQKIN